MKAETKTIRILTADDHALLRKGIASLVAIEPDMELVAQASTGREAIEQFRRHQPDVTLMDLQMPDITGMEMSMSPRSGRIDLDFSTASNPSQASPEMVHSEEDSSDRRPLRTAS